MRPDRAPEAHVAERPPQPHGGRSACAAEARRQETARILAMTSRDRVLLALDLGARFAPVANAPPEQP